MYMSYPYGHSMNPSWAGYGQNMIPSWDKNNSEEGMGHPHLD